jgi:hypothetical protein
MRIPNFDTTKTRYNKIKSTFLDGIFAGGKIFYNFLQRISNIVDWLPWSVGTQMIASLGEGPEVQNNYLEEKISVSDREIVVLHLRPFPNDAINFHEHTIESFLNEVSRFGR